MRHFWVVMLVIGVFMMAAPMACVEIAVKAGILVKKEQR